MASDLTPLFRPRSVAVIGASTRERSIGNRVVRNLLDQGFRGGVFPVNPAAAQVCGVPAFPSIDAVPGPVDLVNVALPAAQVPATLDACGRAGVRAAILHSSGFAEAGPEGAALERAALDTARRHGIRLLGPNAQGAINTDDAVRLYASFTFTPLRPGPVTILAQSGGVAELLNLHLRSLGVGFRLYASPGNACDVGLTDLLEYAADDPGTGVILLHLEALPPTAAFLDAARRAAARCPVVAVKSGNSEAGARAVASHTGALATSDALANAVFDACGIQRARSLREAVGMAAALSSRVLPRGPRVAVVCNAGGPGVAAVDAVVDAGLQPAALSDASRAALLATQSPYAAAGTLVDLAATAGPEATEAAVSHLLADPDVDTVLAVLVTPFFVDCAGVADRLAALGRNATKPLLSVVMTDERWAGVLATLRQAGMPTFEFPEDGVRGLAALHERAGIALRFADTRTPCRAGSSDPAGAGGLTASPLAPAPAAADLANRPPAAAVPAPFLPPGFDASRARSLLAAAPRDANGLIPQAVAYAVLAACGIPAEAPVRVPSPDDLAGLPYPLVLKADPPGVVHKAAAGAVCLDLADTPAAREAWRALADRFPGAPLLAQRQVPGGVEMLVGVAPSPFGPLVAVGAGGSRVERERDAAFALAPVDTAGAMRLLGRLRCAGGLDPADARALADVLVRLSCLAAQVPAVREADLNPVKLAGGRAVAVDARVRL